MAGTDRHISLQKDASGKLGLRVKALSTGVFVCMVVEGSPAAKGGLRFGDQILEVDLDDLAGLNSDQVHDLLAKKPQGSTIKMTIRKRPHERKSVLHEGWTSDQPPAA